MEATDCKAWEIIADGLPCLGNKVKKEAHTEIQRASKASNHGIRLKVIRPDGRPSQRVTFYFEAATTTKEGPTITSANFRDTTVSARQPNH